jgi:hypothetical protein
MILIRKFNEATVPISFRFLDEALRLFYASPFDFRFCVIF